MADDRVFKPQCEIHIGGLHSLHYFQLASGHVFSGEKHSFWEMVYVDQGEVKIGAGKDIRQLYPGQLLFQKPNALHSIRASDGKGAGIFVISFACRSAAVRALHGKQFTVLPAQKRLLSRMITEGQLVFGSALDIADQEALCPLPNAPRGGAQMIVLCLTQLLLDLLRAQEPSPARPTRPRLTGEPDFAAVFEHAREMMRARLDGSVRFEQVCRDAGLSATVFKERFRRYAGVTVMEYYRLLRVEEARRRLRAGEKNISQIADELGYSSTAAFSRQFKQLMKMTPSEYLCSIRA